jgi:cation/acetate symporter
VAISLLSMGLGVVFENQNIAFMVGPVFAIAASANFPVILLSIMWSDLTTRGAVSGSIAGLLSSVGLVALSPGVWTATLKLGSAPFPYDNPALVSVPLAFAVSWAVSVLDRSTAATLVRDHSARSMFAPRPDWVSNKAFNTKREKEDIE